MLPWKCLSQHTNWPAMIGWFSVTTLWYYTVWNKTQHITTNNQVKEETHWKRLTGRDSLEETHWKRLTGRDSLEVLHSLFALNLMFYGRSRSETGQSLGRCKKQLKFIHSSHGIQLQTDVSPSPIRLQSSPSSPLILIRLLFLSVTSLAELHKNYTLPRDLTCDSVPIQTKSGSSEFKCGFIRRLLGLWQWYMLPK